MHPEAEVLDVAERESADGLVDRRPRITHPAPASTSKAVDSH
jgi:hypothetical protein